MSNFVFELNEKGVRELLNSAQIEKALSKYASQVQKRAGDGFEVLMDHGSTRSQAKVIAESEEAVHRVYEENILLKAVRK